IPQEGKKEIVASTHDHAAQLQSALTLHQQGRLDEAEALYKDILLSEPGHFDALQLLATLTAQKKNFAHAVQLFNRALTINPDHPVSLNNRGTTLAELKKYEEAIESFERAIALNSAYSTAYSNLGNALQELKRYGEALASYEKAITFEPANAESYYNHGITLQKLQRHEEAIESYDKAISINPQYAEAYNNRGNALLELKRYKEAIECYEITLALKSDSPMAYYNLGITLQELKRHEEAIGCFEKAIALKPDYAEAYDSLGNALHQLKRHEMAVASYEKAIALNPDFAEAYYNLGNTFNELKQHEKVVESFARALELKPDIDFLTGIWLHSRMLICDWKSFDIHVNQIAVKIKLHEKASLPFPLLVLIDSPSLQKEAARIFTTEKYPANLSLPALPKPLRHDKIRIGYYSADFNNHAMAYLMAELFELHDRSKFEFVAFSFGPDKHDEMRKRIESSFERFLDIRTITDKEAVVLARDLEIDIAVDLNGFTKNSRQGIFALRAAPIQVNYLGYPGTMGADYLDYLIADKTIIPKNSREYYTEKIVSLPNSYQVNDSKRIISGKLFTRKEAGLPESGFIFCCFNNNHKITPHTFDSWMRILGQVEKSVLWLFEDNPKAADNLRKEAIQRGIEAERLIFARRMPLQEHLARHRLADLFLDTLPYNAHTTASDALWTGLPVVTCMGESFASRVAASLLNALHLPELITSSQESYEALAIELATNPEKLAQIRRKLAENRLTAPLFDTQLFTRHIEAAYTAMYERYHADLPPWHIDIDP
ncbi:MAG: tetratricopeptide repeat protein, partial [Chlorobium sp.]